LITLIQLIYSDHELTVDVALNDTFMQEEVPVQSVDFFELRPLDLSQNSVVL